MTLTSGPKYIHGQGKNADRLYGFDEPHPSEIPDFRGSFKTCEIWSERGEKSSMNEQVKRKEFPGRSGKLAGDFPFHRPCNRFSAGTDMEFRVDVVEMESDRMRAYEQFLPNRLV